MSTALLKKSLELVDTEFVRNSKVHRRKNREKKVYTELKLKNKNKKHKETRSIADVKQGNLNSVEKIRKQLKKKNVNDSYKKKLKLLHTPPSRKLVEQVLGYLGYAEDTKKKAEEEQKTAFTEEDFLKFEKEYVDTD
ncbi:unnamed protein product [Nezara viridula]|uniref:Active regulator of SIRT1 n=1 Tax=Nezara viridula TaxID=85310 RepID=A0A9P0MLE7_NEZVI|nr:unnamed protein product [Nezara viridula]